jgi:hypothetical protein
MWGEITGRNKGGVEAAIDICPEKVGGLLISIALSAAFDPAVRITMALLALLTRSRRVENTDVDESSCTYRRTKTSPDLVSTLRSSWRFPSISI